jgi:ADP-dependent NAD(P)H-hydrate dehydratase
MPHSPDLKPFTLPAIPLRAADGHKGTFGKVVMIGGSVGMSGAICLAAVAALRSGSGLVTAAVPAAIQNIVASFEPCLMTIGLPDDSEAGLLALSDTRLQTLIQGRDAIGIGPGMGRNSAASQLLQDVLAQARCPVVVDADGLNIAAEKWMFADPRNCPCVITPHPGEFSRLTGRSIVDIEKHREELAQEFAAAHRLIVALKGPGTIVTDGTRLYRNTTGNSGMGTGGSGDVLTGIVASLLGQGLPAFEATALAVHAHGVAGDVAAERFTQRGMIASDLLPCLPEAWRRLEEKVLLSK